jgi:hypothetical protein
MPQVLDQRGYPVSRAFLPKYGFGQSVAYTGTAGTIANEISTIEASTVLTSNGTIPSDGDTVTIGNKTYTFKSALSPTEGEVLIAGSAANALVNLGRAINHTGTPDTDYKCAAAHTQVEAGTATATTLPINALVGGTAANAYETTDTAGVRLVFTAATLTGGVDNARNTKFVRVMITTAGFVRIGVSPTAVVTDYALAANTPEILPCAAGDKVSAVQSASGGTLYVMELD